VALALHLTGPVLVDPREVRAEAWVLDGRITCSAPAGWVDVTTVHGRVLPGLV
jgi:hypothetical protein